MNFLGHSYAAFKVEGRINPYLVAGSWLPDLVPFVPSPVFTFAEIHESPDKFLRFLDKKYPYARDLAIGMMTHSVKYGADRFNREIEGWLIEDQREKIELAKKIVDCSGVSLEVASKARLHNYLWSGIDLYLLNSKPEFVHGLAEFYPKINHEELVRLLAECFAKEGKEVRGMINCLLAPIRPEFFTSLSGLVKIWKVALAGLPEKDEIDEEKTVRLFREIYQLFSNKWGSILEKVIIDVERRMRFLI
ncbi:hypothetical protein FJZ40_03325 [Candidatus Shapirobacteria bacterium]|nr:hypothetical protein [Candidatus Shapirobacteria bacterium]